MPIIELLGDGQDGNRVLARMYYPNDDLGCAYLLQSLNESIESDCASSGRNSLRLSETGWRGTLAGEILLRIAAMHENGMDEPSVRKAIFAVKQRGERRAREESGTHSDRRDAKGLVLSLKSFWNYHAEFDSVSHFWAAHAVLETTTPFFEVPAELAEAEALNTFLTHAEWFLDFGCQQKSRNTHDGTLLDRNCAWVVSPPSTSVAPDLASFAETIAAELKGYHVENP